MKSIFRGYFKPSDDELQTMWHENTIVLDTNVLLHLYRYSDETRRKLMDLLTSVRERLWVPRKVIDEFLGNRLGVLSGQIREYDKTTKLLEEIEKDLTDKRKHPFVQNKTLNTIQATFELIKRELSANQDELISKLTNDEILNQIGDLLNGRVGSGFSQEELEDIYAEGLARFEKRIPPGFIDAKIKADSGDNYRIYGDLILWKEVLRNAAENNRGAIFVSDDKKEDWWLEANGRKIGPRPELIQEFQEGTRQSFIFYTVDGFVGRARKFLKSDVDTDVIAETKDVREATELESPKHVFGVIDERRLIEKLADYESFIGDDPDTYVGLKHFVTSVLGKQGYEINHSYAIINDLIDEGIVMLYDRSTDLGPVKAITLRRSVTQ